ncbi:MAG: TlpA family protein disulfide reductase [Chitinophagaceae bacterium]
MKAIAAIFFSLFVSCAIIAQNTSKLTVGDTAPEIRYSKWLKGTPINSFKEDHVYVLEFWATWCSFCIKAMPHLSELSKKYSSEATFIGVDVMENTGDQPYESCLPAVTKFVNSPQNTMTYDVMVDNNATDMENKWLKAAGIRGLPTTFIIHKGRIAWIGHPMKMDKYLEEIVKGSYDTAANRKEFSASLNDMEVKLAAISSSNKDIADAIEAKDYKKALEAVEVHTKLSPFLSLSLGFRKFEILLNHFSEKEAMSYLMGTGKSNAYLNMAAPGVLAKKDGLTIPTYVFAANQLNSQAPATSSILDLQALAWSKAGQYDKAIASQEKAIAQAKSEIGDPNFKGRVTEKTVTEFQRKLDEYKSKTK